MTNHQYSQNKPFIKCTFDNFVAENINEIYLKSKFVSTEPGILLIYGDNGTGKTHLLHAIANQALFEYPNLKYELLHAEMLVKNITMQVDHCSVSRYINYLMSLDLLLIDDIDYLSNKYKIQNRLLDVLNQMRGMKVVFSSGINHTNIEGIAPDLKEYMASVVNIQLKPPSYMVRRSILQQAMVEMNLENVDTRIVDMIANKLQSVRDLQSVVRRIVFKTRVNNIKVTYKIASDSIEEHQQLEQRMKLL